MILSTKGAKFGSTEPNAIYHFKVNILTINILCQFLNIETKVHETLHHLSTYISWNLTEWIWKMRKLINRIWEVNRHFDVTNRKTILYKSLSYQHQPHIITAQISRDIKYNHIRPFHFYIINTITPTTVLRRIRLGGQYLI